MRIQREHLVVGRGQRTRDGQADAFGPAGHECASHGSACIYVRRGCFNGSTISDIVRTMIRGWPWARLVFGLAVAGTVVAIARTIAGGSVPWWCLVTLALALVS